MSLAPADLLPSQEAVGHGTFVLGSPDHDHRLSQLNFDGNIEARILEDGRYAVQGTRNMWTRWMVWSSIEAFRAYVDCMPRVDPEGRGRRFFPSHQARIDRVGLDDNGFINDYNQEVGA